MRQSLFLERKKGLCLFIPSIMRDFLNQAKHVENSSNFDIFEWKINHQIAMTAKTQHVQRLSNAQLLLLNLFEHDLWESDLESLRKNLVNFLNTKLQDELDSIILEKNMTLEDINQDEIGNNRTEFLTKIGWC